MRDSSEETAAARTPRALPTWAARLTRVRRDDDDDDDDPPPCPALSARPFGPRPAGGAAYVLEEEFC